MSKVLLVTIVIGAPYLERYKVLFHENHRIYASKCNYDFIVVTDFLDPKINIPALLVYKRVLYALRVSAINMIKLFILMLTYFLIIK